MRALLLAVSLASATALGFGGVRGDGKLATKTHDVTGFRKIVLEVAMDAEVRQADDFLVSVKTDSNLQPLVEVTVEGETLTISSRGEIDPDDDSRITIRLPELRSLRQAGAGDVKVSGVRVPALRLVVEGAGDLDFSGEAKKLETRVTGTGEIVCKLSAPAEDVLASVSGAGGVEFRRGQTQHLVAEVSGTGGIDAKALQAQNGDFTISGVGGIETTLAGGEASFRVSGVGSIDWWGDAEVLEHEASGIGSIQHRG